MTDSLADLFSTPAPVLASSLTIVCSWHTPPAELAVLNRAHPGQISHTICSDCQRRVFAEDAQETAR